jgi:hypothetical protein
MPNGLRYLTVQDVLWIHLQVAEHTCPFNYDDLEGSVFAQYGYGESTHLLQQALQFLTTFLHKKPFECNNTATAWISFLVFLHLNHQAINVPDEKGLEFLEQFALAPTAQNPLEVLKQVVTPIPPEEEVEVQDVTINLIARFPKTLRACKEKP